MGSSSGIKNIFIYIYIYILSSQAPPMTPVTMGEREREREIFWRRDREWETTRVMHRTY